MPNLYQNFLRGTLTADPGAGGATLTSAELASMAVVASPDCFFVTLDPDGVNGAPEVVKITTHSSAATTAAMTRAQQGTVARAHPVGTVWRHTLTASDMTNRLPEFKATSSTRPTGTDIGQGVRLHETDTNEDLVYYATPAQWRRPWTMPWGYIANSNTTTPTVSGTLGVPLTVASVTWTAVANRRYRVAYHAVRVLAGATGDTVVTVFTNAADVAQSNASVTLFANNDSMSLVGWCTITPAAGSYTMKLRSASVGANAVTWQNSNYETRMLVEDIGPNGVPA